MVCRSCGCPGAAEMLFSVMCLNDRCTYYDPWAYDKAVIDNYEYTANGDSLLDIQHWLNTRDNPEQDR